MRWAFMLIVLALSALASAIPKISLIEYTPNCGGYNEAICSATYEVVNQDVSLLTVNAVSDLQFKFRSEKDLNIKTESNLLTKTAITYSSDGKDFYNDPKIIMKISAGSKFFVRISSEKEWKLTGIGNEEYMENVDQIPSFFGVDYPEFAWWNTSFSYRQILNITNNSKNPTITDFVFNFTFDSLTPITAAKMLSNCSDVRFTYLNSSGENPIPYFLYEDVGFLGSTFGKCAGGKQNATVFIRIPLLSNSTNTTIYLYYGNPTANAGSNPHAATFVYDAPTGTEINYTVWDNATQGDGGNVSVLNNENRILGKAGISAWMNISIARSTAGSITSYKKVIFLGRSVAGTSSYIYPAYSDTANFRMDTIGATAQAISLNYSPSGTSCYLQSGTQCTTGGTPSTLNGTVFRMLAGGVAADFRFTNVTMISWLPFATNYQTGIEEGTTSGTIIVNAYDELTGLAIYFNATFANSSTSYTTANGLSASLSSGSLPQGSNTISFYNASYYSSNLILTIDNNSQTINGYLLPLSTSVIRDSFHVQSYAGVQIANALVTVQKLIGSSYVTVKQCLTDSSGTCSLYLDISANYQVIFSATGYTTLTQNINPASDHTIILQGGSNPTYQPTLEGIYIYFSPQILNISENWTIINFTIRDDLGQLAYWGLNISYQGNITYNGEFTSANGGAIAINVSTANRTENVTAIAYWKKTTGTIQTFVKVYYLYGFRLNTDWSLTTLKDSLSSGGGGNSIVFVALLFSMVTVAYVTRYMPVVIGGGVIAVVSLYVFLPFAVGSAYTGFIFGFFLVVLLVIAIVLAMLKARV